MHFTVADLRQVWIVLHVRTDDVGRLRREQEVPSGRIVWISAEVDEKTRTPTPWTEAFRNQLGTWVKKK